MLIAIEKDMAFEIKSKTKLLINLQNPLLKWVQCCYC